MVKYNCIIIEDEPLGAEILESYVQQIPFLNLVQTFSDAISALSILQKEKIELLFLDIHLPKIKGLDFLKTLEHPPKVIITTAYHEYALQGYEHNCIDYLLKPIEFGRFLTAVNKLKQLKDFKVNLPDGETEKPFLFLNINKKKTKILLEDILFIEGQKQYIKVVTLTQSLITKLSIHQMQEMLPSADFLRVHRSFIVSKNKIDAYMSSYLELKKHSIPIGRSYKELVHEQLRLAGQTSK